VARVFLNEPGWVVRGVTRDPSKPSAKKWGDQGVELVAGNLDDAHSLTKAFQGTSVIFGLTDFWQHLTNPENHKLAAEQGRTPNEVAYDCEVSQGKAIVVRPRLLLTHSTGSFCRHVQTLGSGATEKINGSYTLTQRPKR
jgi:hypothetical protein